MIKKKSKSPTTFKISIGKGGKSLPQMKGKKPSAENNPQEHDKRGGPANASGFRAPLKPTAKKENLYQTGKFSLGVEKKEQTPLNNGMSKSAFDTLYEDVMSNPSDLGDESEHKDLEALDVEPDGEGDGDLDDMGGDEVTISLPRDLAQQLCDALNAHLGGSEDQDQNDFSDEEAGAEDLGADMGGEGPLPESIQVQAEPKAFTNKGEFLRKHSSMKVNSTVTGKPSSKAAETGAPGVKDEAEPKELKHTVNDGKGSKMRVAPKIVPGKSMFD